MDNAICGGSGSTLTGAALAAVKVAIFMGDPHNRNGLPYNVGTCKAGGVSPHPPAPSSPHCLFKYHSDERSQFAQRPAGFTCSPANTSIIQSYCDAADPYCCNGNDANTHQQYVNKYGSQALAFIKSKVTA
jgi:acetylxylan esterase